MRRTVGFLESDDDGTDNPEDDYVHVTPPGDDAPPAAVRPRSATFSEGVSPMPRIPTLDVQSPLPPRSATRSAAATALGRTQSGDADLCALQRLFPDDAAYSIATPGRSLLWEGRCTCVCAGTGGSALPTQPDLQDAAAGGAVELPDYHLMLLNDALVWARRSTGTIASPLRPIEVRVLRTAKVREGFDRNSAVVGHLKGGSTVTVVERRENQLGQVRARIAASFGVVGGAGGWVSLGTEDGEELLSPLWLDVQFSFEVDGALGLMLGRLPAEPGSTNPDACRVALLGVTHGSLAAKKPELVELCEQRKPAVLASVAGVSVHGRAFSGVLDLIKDSPRPLVLVFKYQPATEMTPDCRAAALNHLRPQALTYEHSLPLDDVSADGSLTLERYPDTVVSGRYLSRLFAVREVTLSEGDTCPPEYRWWVFSLFEQDETEVLISKLAAQLGNRTNPVVRASVRGPDKKAEQLKQVEYPYWFLSPRRPPARPPQILPVSTVLQHCPKVQHGHDGHGLDTFVAEEVLSESGTTQTRTVTVQFSATEGVVTADTQSDPRVIVGVFSMDAISAFECNAAKTVFRLYFHRSGRIENGSCGKEIHGMDVDSVHFKTDQAEGMRQAMAMAWSAPKRRTEQEQSVSPRYKLLEVFTAWRDEAHRPCPSSGSFESLTEPEGASQTAWYVQVVQVRRCLADQALDLDGAEWACQLQVGKRFARLDVSAAETWKSPQIMHMNQEEEALSLHLSRCAGPRDADRTLLDERCGSARLDLAQLADSPPALEAWLPVREAQGGTVVAMLRVAVLVVTRENFELLSSRGVTCARDYHAQEDGPVRDQLGFLADCADRIAWKSLQSFHLCAEAAQHEAWERQVDRVEERLRHQVWRGVAPGHRQSVWVAMTGATKLRDAHSPSWYDECLEVSAAASVSNPKLPAGHTRKPAAQAFASVCGFIRTVSLPRQVTSATHSDVCRRVLLAFCAHKIRVKASAGLSEAQMRDCVWAIACVVSQLFTHLSSEEDTFWVLLALANCGVFDVTDPRTVADLQAIDRSLLQRAPALHACLNASSGADDSASVVFRTLYQPLICQSGAGLGVARLWDAIFLEGRAALRACIVALLCASADAVLGAESADSAIRECTQDLLQNTDALLLSDDNTSGLASVSEMVQGGDDDDLNEQQADIEASALARTELSGAGLLGGEEEGFIFLEFSTQAERQSDAAQLQRKHTHLRNLEKERKLEKEQFLNAANQAASAVREMKMAGEVEMQAAAQEAAAAVVASQRRKRAESAALDLELELRGLRLLGTGRSAVSSPRQRRSAVCTARRTSSAEDC